MYAILLMIHSWLRWVVIALGLTAVGRAVGGVGSGRVYDARDNFLSRALVITVDVQLLLGLGLYFGLSPFTQTALANFGGAMKDRMLRFWAVEHGFAMVLGIALVHVARVRVRRAPDAKKHRTAALWLSIALLLILAGVPWPFMPYGRDWFRMP